MSKKKNSNNNTTACATYPWYDDRVQLRDDGDDGGSDSDGFDSQENVSGQYNTPKKIYEYLDKHVWKQEEAKRAASVIAYSCFERGIKTNAMFVGPTGCGKTHIWRCLKRLFPDRIEIVDGSNLTQDGWRGNKKWNDLLCSQIFRSGKKAILVIDEADKMLTPKYTSSGENASHSIQSEGLTLMEGTCVNIKDGSVSYQIDTNKISFILCGAFSVKAHDIAEKKSGSRMGFGAAPEETKAYDRPLKEADLMEFGVMPEFMGRMQKIVNLGAMTVDDYYRMTDSPCGPLQRVRRQYRAKISLTSQMRHELAEAAYKNGLGIRGMENRIRAMVDEALFEDCNLRCFEF